VLWLQVTSHTVLAASTAGISQLDQSAAARNSKEIPVSDGGLFEQLRAMTAELASGIAHIRVAFQKLIVKWD